MTTDPITRLNAALEGRYRIEREIGEGGMATVYLAEDLRHERRVALKVLKSELAAVVGAERFLAEIKTTANLQHPHILPLYDSGEADGFLYYVMPYVEGESLRERLDRDHQLPVNEAVQIATNVAEALDYAHRQGVIHRDIKPANVLMLSGKPVISDFGIALAVGAAGGGRLTETGLSLGTPHYMSPEQATGDQNVGPQTDLYALGCVLYETLIGEPPYTGPNAQAVLGRIITAEPVSATKKRASVPPNVDAAIGKALEKLPADRFPGAQEFVRALVDPGFRHEGETAAGHRSSWTPLSVGATGVAAVATIAFAVGLGMGGLGWRSFVGETGEDARPVRFRIAGNYWNQRGRAVAISPDGTHIAHSTTGSPLAVRSMDRSETEVELLRTAASQPFFSPNGDWVGFFSFGSLMQIPIAGGAPLTITSLEDSRSLGGSWGDDDAIVFAGTLGLYRVSVQDGELELLASPDPENGEQYYAWPEVLPGGQAVLYTIIPRGSGSDAESIIAALDIESREPTILLRGGSGARYASTGHLIYSAGAALHAVGFDSSSLEVSGEPVQLPIEGLHMIQGSAADFDVSENGTLVYVPADMSSSPRTLMWVDREGREEPLSAPPRRYVYPRVSPDGSHVAVDISEAQRDVYLWDLRRESLSRLTDDPAEDFLADWSPDGRRVFFSSNRNGPFNIFSRAADGTGQAEPFFESASVQFFLEFTPDGERVLAGQVREGATDLDIVSLSVSDPVQMETLLSTNYSERDQSISPDGNWLAYASDASGQLEVYVGPFADLEGQRWRVSIDGGTHPLWALTGDELFYQTLAGELMVAAVDPVPDFQVEQVNEVFPQGGPLLLGTGSRRYDISPIDGRFLMTKLEEEAEGNGITVILNWLQEVTQRVPPP